MTRFRQQSHPGARTRLLTILVLAAAATLACATPPAPGATVATTFVLVRHAEKSTGDDPPLTAAGVARAQALARGTADLGLDAVYATPFRRTQATAVPAAVAAGVEVRTDPVRTDDLDGYYAGFVVGLLERHAGERVLVVGHSNTVPVIVEALGVEQAPRLSDDDYDDLFVVVVTTTPSAGGSRSAELLHLHYGEASP